VTPTLSKSRFINGSQCHLRLWHDYHAPRLAKPANPTLQAIFDTGHEVGDLACARYPSGHIHNDVVRSRRSTFRHDKAKVVMFVTLLYRNSEMSA